jgi:DNA-binding transcriptional MerR regulator
MATDGAPRSNSQPSRADEMPLVGSRIARFYMSGDLRAVTGLSRTHLDFYLREGIVQPTARTESGYLLFDEDELGRLRRVITWREDGVGLREIRERLERLRSTDRVSAEHPAGT